MQTTFADVLRNENVILRRWEQKHLLAQVTRSILEEMLESFDARSSTV